MYKFLNIVFISLGYIPRSGITGSYGRYRGFPGGSDSKESACNAVDRCLILGWGRSPGEGGGWLPTPVFLPRKSHRQRSLAGYSPWDHKESDTTEQLHFDFHISSMMKDLIIFFAHF